MKTRHSFYLSVTITVTCLIFSACTTTTAPTSDTTPPILTWFIHNQTTGDTSSIAGNGTVNGSMNDTFSITLKAEDPQGIKFIQLGGNGQMLCQGGGPEFPQSTASFALGQDSQSLSPDSSGNVLTSIILIKPVAPETTCASASFSLINYKVFLDGLGSNYFPGDMQNTQARLVIVFTP